MSETEAVRRRLDRRTVLKVAGAGGAALMFSSMPGAAPAAAAKRRAYVLVIDGCRPDEIGGGRMPTVKALRDRGLWYPRARSLPVFETLPNHVMMMTGVKPDRSGVPANEIYDRSLRAVRKMDRPSDVRVATLIEQVNRSGRTTGTVLSKEYLYGVFSARATHRWEPFPVVPISGHAPDAFTMDAATAMVKQFDPHFMFVNLGSVDRMGHMDLTGTTLRAARTSALGRVDNEIKKFVDLLKATGRWQHSLIVVLADHSMDWSTPDKVVSLAPLYDADPMLAGRYVIADNGGADLVYWTGSASEKTAAIATMRRLAMSHDGVLAAHDRAATSWLRLGARGGDVVVFCKAGWRFSDPGLLDNPIPGNHGHPATRPIPFFLSGGHPRVDHGVRTAWASTIDVAPTVGAFFGIAAPRTGWEGRSRL
ncbi:alkaline phosphatase family protein [Nocardioides speluncae]|uniref:alkaline phosphatase family protein n=1 Tax=Nocardioides speluncae TaxID=2670337 RepID=UPI000D69258A|nr:alkaline phosphatase family protein [Nocardioides speluncae]